MDRENFIIYITTGNMYLDIEKDVETRFDISNYELNKALPKRKRKIMIEFAALRPKT